MHHDEVMVDLDSVVYPFIGAFARWVRSVHPNASTFSTRSWRFYRDLGIHDDDFARYVAAFGQNGGFDRPVAPMSPVWPIADLWGRGHRVHIVTARPKTDRIVSDTKSWLARVGLPYDTLTFSPDKTQFLRFVRSQVSWAVDDHADNVRAMVSAGVRAMLFAQPHNVDERHGLVVVRSLEAFRSRVLSGRW
jgi:hypothetical protein